MGNKKLYLKTNNKSEKFYNNDTFACDGDSGMDLYFVEDQVISAGSTVLVDLEICCELKDYNNKVQNGNLFINKSYFLLPRSSIYKTPLRLANSVGLIDAGYRGNIKVPLDNISDEDYKISKGSRLFQIVSPGLECFDVVLTDKLSDTDRGTKGFGSSGK